MKALKINGVQAFGPYDSIEVTDEGFLVYQGGAPAMIPASVVEGSVELADWGGPLPQPQSDPLRVQAATVEAIQRLLDSTAQAHGYDHIVSVISYAGSSIPKWSAEGTRAKAWRDECWFKAYEIQEAVKAGTMPLPTVEEVLAQMPAANWPPEPTPAPTAAPGA
ncbi:MAG: hypothetical protein ACYC0T_21360 [Ramlibacter sp.]